MGKSIKNRKRLKNFSIKRGEKIHWVSRSVAVTGIVYCIINGSIHVLCVKRGEGASEFKGLWCLPCGYLDYDESTLKACIREIYEETGINVEGNNIRHNLFNIQDATYAHKQNITFRYCFQIDPSMCSIPPITQRGGEKDEISGVKWIPLQEIQEYEWAFNHGLLIEFAARWDFKQMNSCLIV